MTPVLQEGGRDHALALVRLTADILDISGSGLGRFSVEVAGERCTQQGCVGDLRRGSDECCRNAPGMLDGAF